MKKAIVLSLIFLCLILLFGIEVSANERAAGTREVAYLSIESYPEKTVYSAFEKFQADGMLLRAIYTDGSEKTVPNRDLIVGYENDSCFRVGDRAVTLSYGGKSISLPVTVNRIPYDLSSIEFSSIKRVYNGRFQGYGDSAPEIVGLDGVKLGISMLGGGINVGNYDVIIDFHSESADYFLPDSRVATLVIEPSQVELVWSNLSFNYDGKSKSPSASYVDVGGNRVYPSVVGAATNAGSGYLATAYCSDPNYSFKNPSQSFEIKKGSYDFSGVKWSADSFVYDGGQKSVTLSGLPSGVSIIKYTNQSYSKAGKYTTTAELDWDKNNYNDPPILTHSWEIKKADYDMSGVVWQNTVVTYSGEKLSPSLSGLPDGVKVTSYIGADALNAGSYSVIAVLDYDRENYNPPALDSCNFVIEKRPINIPILKTTYNGKAQSPSVQSNLYAVISRDEFTDAGVYAVTLLLIDPQNYVFAETQSDSANAIFQILPARISVKVSDQRLHLFEEARNGEISIVSGIIFADDVLDVSFFEENGEIFAKSENPNYVLAVDSGKIIRLPYPTFKTGVFMLIILIALCVLGLLIATAIRRRADIVRALAMAKCKFKNRNFSVPHPIATSPANVKLPEYDEPEEEGEEEPEVIDLEDGIRFMDSQVDSEKADLLITDQLAKSLLKKEGDIIYTDGSGKESIDIGKISEAFSYGEIVDINALKKRGIVSKDASYIRITEGGTLDKALTVYSNEFSLSAIKMIALSGGQAIKCITLKGKNGKTT